ncbi:MAG: tRNA (guanosine(37)-N1)-methyltransferase TrmD [Phycisphaerales bacterium]|nr:MAG: tRNA (guanosine(37)-N1)-methyltransferase TrmD [Phycisphaerales bacterium]
MRIDILTLFPEMFPDVLSASILGRAAEGGFASYHLHDIREYADNKHRKVDDRPFGGGPGMVMMCQPLYDAVIAAERQDERPAKRILLTPQGEPLRQERIESLATEDRLLLIAGHYEGVDERVIDELEPLEISAGDYVLSGGELPAMMLVDAVVRLLPGVLGHEDSAAEDSFAARDFPPSGIGKEGGSVGGACGGTFAGGGRRLLDCPHYTRPRIWKDRAVPEVLLSGDHAAVEEWRKKQMIERTRKRRPDLLEDRDP